MNTKRLLLSAVLIAMLLALHGTALAAPQDDPPVRKGSLAGAREATGRYKNLNAAEKHGYTAFLHCMSSPQAGGMGFHYVNGKLVDDAIKDNLIPYGVPPFYELHVWLWKRNANGLFTDFNPKVSCPQE